MALSVADEWFLNRYSCNITEAAQTPDDNIKEAYVKIKVTRTDVVSGARIKRRGTIAKRYYLIDLIMPQIAGV